MFNKGVYKAFFIPPLGGCPRRGWRGLRFWVFAVESYNHYEKRSEGRMSVKNEFMNQEQKDELNRMTKNMMMEMLKDDLCFIADIHAQEPDKSMTKEELVEKINKVLLQEFEHDCEYLLPQEIFYIMDLYLQFEKKNPTKINSIFQSILSDYNYEKDEIDGDYLVQMGYFQIKRKGDQQFWLVPYPTIMDSFVSNFMSLLKKSFENQKMLNYLIALSNIYGWYSYDQFIHIWNLYNENKITEEDADIFIEKTELKDAQTWIEDNTIISEAIPMDDYPLSEGTRQNLPWYTPSEEMIEKNIDSHVDEDSEAYKAMKAFFTKNRGNIKTDKELELIIFDLMLDMKFDSYPSTAYDILQEHNYVFKDEQSVTRFLKMYMEISNNSRKWVLKGFTPIEVNMLFKKH